MKNRSEIVKWLRENPYQVKGYLRRIVRSGNEKARAEAVQIVRESGFLDFCKGARQRELVARHLLFHPENISKASQEDRMALEEYVKHRGWSSLYNHDRRMYRLLRLAAEKYAQTQNLQTSHQNHHVPNA